MVKKYLNLCNIGLLTFVCVFMPLNAFAADNQYQNPLAQNYKSIKKYEHDWSYNLNTEFEITAEPSESSDNGTPRELLEAVENPNKAKEEKSANYFVKKNFEDKILEKIPHGTKLKNMWNIVDGDVDVYFQGLKVDRRNKGLTYTIKNLNFIGGMNDIELEFSAGRDNEVSFKTHMIPFMGTLEGFSLKGTAGTDDNKIFARYTIPLD